MTDNEETIVIVTRMSGLQNEFENYFGNDNKVCVILKNNNEAFYYNEIPNSSLIKECKVIYFDGKANNYYKDFRERIIELSNSKNILLAFHPGIDKNKEEARTELELPENIISAEYSLGDDLKEHIIGILGKAIKVLLDNPNSRGNLTNKIEAVRNYIIKENKSPIHLIALNILCQGFLISHNEILYGKKITVNIDEKQKLSLEKKDWWIVALGDNFKNNIDAELSLLNVIESRREPITKLIKKIDSDNITLESVRDAMITLKNIFSIKTLSLK